MKRTFTRTLGVALAAVCWAASPLVANEEEELAALTESISATAQDLSAELQAKKLNDKAFMRRLVTQLIKSYGVQNRFLVAQVVVKQHPEHAALMAKEIVRHSPVDTARLIGDLGERNVETALTNAGLASSILSSRTSGSSRSLSIPSSADRRRITSTTSGGTNTLTEDSTDPTYTRTNGLNSGTITGDFTATNVTNGVYGAGASYNVSWTGASAGAPNGSGVFTLTSVVGNVYTFDRTTGVSDVNHIVLTLD